MFSIYTSLFNLSGGFIDWEAALENFSSFGDEVIVATTNYNNDISPQLLHNYVYKYTGNCKIRIVETNISLEDYDFDGRLKNEALKRCTQDFCILLDADERIRLKDLSNWIRFANFLGQSKDFDAFLIPVVDLFNTEKEFKSLSLKWYLHKNLPNLQRGIVNFAKRPDGKIDISRSDTCELIYDNGSLCESVSLCGNVLTLSRINDIGIKIFHLGWLNKQKRLQTNQFWKPVWSNRAGEEVDNIILSEEELNKIEYKPHGLKLWYE